MMSYTKQHAQQNKVMLERAMQVVAEFYELERDKDKLDFEYHLKLQYAVYTAIEQLLGNISRERKERIHAKALRRHRGKLARQA